MFQAIQRPAPLGRSEDAPVTFVPVAFEVVEPEQIVAVRAAPEANLVSHSGPRVLFPDTADPTSQKRRRSVPRPLVAAVVVVLGMLFSFLV